MSYQDDKTNKIFGTNIHLNIHINCLLWVICKKKLKDLKIFYVVLCIVMLGGMEEVATGARASLLKQTKQN